MNGEVVYRAKRAAIVGGVYRRAGDVFTSAKMDDLPAHLEIVDEPASDEAVETLATTTKVKAVRKQTVKEEAQVNAADLGIVPSPVE